MRKAQKKIKKTPQQVLDGRVRSMIQQLNVNPDVSNATPNDILGVYGSNIKEKILRMTPATRGEIADLGIPGNESPFLYATLPIRGSGRDMVVEIAMRTIVLRMYELLKEDADREDKFWRDDAEAIPGQFFGLRK